METIYAGLAMFVFVFLKAFQQRNVAFLHYAPVVPTSLLMAGVEIYVIASVVRLGYDWTLVVSVGLGGGVGALLAMSLHSRIFGDKT